MKTTSRMGDNICKWYDQQGLNSQTNSSYNSIIIKKKTSSQKMGRRPKQVFLQRQMVNWHMKRCSNLLIIQFSSVAQSCPTLCDPMNRSMPGLPVPHKLASLLKLMPIKWCHQWCHPAISSSVIPLSSCPQSFPVSRSFPMSQLFAWGGQSIGVSASASVLPIYTQDWSPLGWTGWISLQSKGLSRVFSNTTVQKHQFFSAQLSSQSNSHIHTWPLEKP